MKSALLHPKEELRLAALRRLNILDTASEQTFDDLTNLASLICQTPMALMSLVDEKRQWFKSRVGVNASETPREVAFCAHAILGTEVFEVRDTSTDERFFDNPLVTEEPKFRFYAGAPLITSDGLPLGTVCVMDIEPRELSKAQRLALVMVSRLASTLLEYRLAGAELAAVNETIKLLSGLIPICSSCKKIRNESGNWELVETYVSNHTEASFTHGICPECAEKLYPGVMKNLKRN